MKRAFIKVKTVSNSHHIIPVDLIVSISPYEGKTEENKSVIEVNLSNEQLFSTETPKEIFKKLEYANSY